MELVAAVAAERFEQVAGEARRVDPDERGRGRAEVAHHEGDRLVARLVLDAVADDPPLAVASGQLGLGHAVDQLLAAPCGSAISISIEMIGRPNSAAIACSRSRLATRMPSRISQRTPAGVRPGQPGEVDRRLGVPRAAEHAPLLGDQREQVAGPDEVGRPASSGR